MHQIRFRPGLCSVPVKGAYSTSPDPLGPTSKGNGRVGEGREGKGWVGKGREGERGVGKGRK